jgi:hypothetical protein
MCRKVANLEHRVPNLRCRHRPVLTIAFCPSTLQIRPVPPQHLGFKEDVDAGFYSGLKTAASGLRVVLPLHRATYGRRLFLNATHSRPQPYARQRRSQRILLCVPVVISGKRSNGAVFSE